MSEQHSSVEWSEESDVMASAAAETPSTEVLAASATEGVSVVMATAALSLLTGVLSLSVERLGTSGVMEAAWSENLRDPSAMAASPLTEMALSLSSVGMGVMTATGAVAVLPPAGMALSLSSVEMGMLVVMTAAGSENPRDSAAMAVSPPAGMALSLSSVGMGVMTATGTVAVFLLTKTVLSLSSVRMGVLVVREPSRPSSNGCITTGRDGVVAVVSNDGRVGSDGSCRV